MIDFNEFFEKYKQHLQWLKLEIPGFEELEKIFQIFSFVAKNGGWARTVGLDQWKRCFDGARKYYESNFLVSFERSLHGSWPYSVEDTKSIDYTLLQTAPMTNSIRPDEWEEILSEDIVIYRNVYNLGIREDLISLETIKRKHGDTEVTVILQEPNSSGSCLKSVKKQKMKIKDYVELMQNPFRNEKYIKFAVNIDFGNWSELVDELRKFLPTPILWCSSDDCLRHLRQNIFGMTLPQLYLKINGCWTGGHEENLRFPSANINHGPSSCEWWGLDSRQSLQMRECILRDENFEIYSKETLWWPDEFYCLLNGLRIYHTIQLPGDLVLIGSGTIHWVKSLGVTTNTSWNFGPKYLSNFQKSVERDYINRAINLKSLVPINILSMDLINNEIENLDLGLIEYLKVGILNKSSEELEIFSQSGLKVLIQNSSDNVLHCEICYQELFRIYYKCLKCVDNRMNGGGKKCFFCFHCIKTAHGRCKGKMVAVEKFGQKDFDELIRQVELRCEGKDCKSVDGLGYPYDKNAQEGVYVSLFNGVKVDCREFSEKEVKITVLEHSEKREKVKKLKKMMKTKNGLGERVKLRSFPAKRRIEDDEDLKPCKKMSDLQKFLRVLEQNQKKVAQDIPEYKEDPEEKPGQKGTKIIFYKDTKEGKQVVIQNESIVNPANIKSPNFLESNNSVDSQSITLPTKRAHSASIYSPVSRFIPSKK